MDLKMYIPMRAISHAHHLHSSIMYDAFNFLDYIELVPNDRIGE